YFVARVEFGSDRSEADWEIVYAGVLQPGFKAARKMAASDQSGSREAEVEITEHAAHGESTGPGFKVVHFFSGITSADNRADRGPDDPVGDDAVLQQFADDADMGKPTRGAAAERQADGRTHGRRLRLR